MKYKKNKFLYKQKDVKITDIKKINLIFLKENNYKDREMAPKEKIASHICFKFSYF